MADDTLELLRKRLPALFAQAVSGLQRRAAAGEAGARKRLHELTHARAAGLIRVLGQGGGDLQLGSDGLSLAVAGAPAAAGAFGHALALPSEVARHGLALLGQGTFQIEELVSAWAALTSVTARDLFAAAGYAFELVITRVPVLGDVRATVSLGQAELPRAPEFVLTVDYDELEDAREQQLGPHQLFMAGKVKIDGDVAKAMMLGMTLAQLR